MKTNQNINLTSRGFLKTVSIVHFALVAAPLFFGVIAFMQTGKTEIDIKNTNDPFMVLVPVMAIVGLVASYIVFKQQIDDIGLAPLKDRLTIYQTALLVRFASLEAPALFAIGSYLIKGNFLFLIIAAFIILYFIYLRPSRSRMDEDLELNEQDKLEF